MNDEFLSETVDLIARARVGDHNATRDLLSRIRPRLEAIVRVRLGSRLRSKLETMDVVQEAMLAALPHLEASSFKTCGSFYHWLARIVENRIRDLADHYFAEKRNSNRERPLESAPSGDSPLCGLASETTPSQIVSAIEETQQLEAAIDSLHDDQREALILVRYEGMTLDEAGRKMNRSRDAVRMLIARAIVRLGQSIGDSTPS